MGVCGQLDFRGSAQHLRGLPLLDSSQRSLKAHIPQRRQKQNECLEKQWREWRTWAADRPLRTGRSLNPLSVDPFLNLLPAVCRGQASRPGRAEERRTGCGSGTRQCFFCLVKLHGIAGSNIQVQFRWTFSRLALVSIIKRGVLVAVNRKHMEMRAMDRGAGRAISKDDGEEPM